MKILVPCVCMIMIVCVAQGGESRRGMTGGQGGTLQRTVVHVGDTFEVSWPLLLENNHMVGLGRIKRTSKTKLNSKKYIERMDRRFLSLRH